MGGALILLASAVSAGLVFLVAFAVSGVPSINGWNMSAIRVFSRTPLALLSAIVGSQLGLGVATIAATAASGAAWRVRLGLVRPRAPLGLLPLFVVASIAMTLAGIVLVEVLARWSWIPEIGTGRRELARRFMAAPGSWAIPIGLAASVLPGWCEELAFRGYVLRGLLARWAPWAAIGVSAAMFAVAHGDPAYAVFTFPDGLWLGYLAWRTGSIIPGMVCHAAVNGTFQTLGRIAMGGAAQSGAEFGASPSSDAARAGTGATLAFVALALAPAVWASVRGVERAARAEREPAGSGAPAAHDSASG